MADKKDKHPWAQWARAAKEAVDRFSRGRPRASLYAVWVLLVLVGALVTWAVEIAPTDQADVLVNFLTLITLALTAYYFWRQNKLLHEIFEDETNERTIARRAELLNVLYETKEDGKTPRFNERARREALLVFLKIERPRIAAHNENTPEDEPIPVDLSGALLQDVKALGIDLQHVNVESANLQRADLSGADLQHANLSGANLQGAILDNANLQSADLIFADLEGARAVGTVLQRAELSGANLQSACLWFAVLRGAVLKDANLLGAYLAHADLAHANLQRAYLRHADFLNAQFDDETDWHGAYIYGARNLPDDVRQAAINQGAWDQPDIEAWFRSLEQRRRELSDGWKATIRAAHARAEEAAAKSPPGTHSP